MGDFYPVRGGRGDPGIGSFFKGLASTVAGFIPGVGSVASKVIEALPIGGGAKSLAASGVPLTTRAISGVKSVVTKHPVLSAAAAAGVGGMAMGAAGEHMVSAMMNGGACPRGHHISKSRHSKSFGKCVRNRRMRVTNPKALRRAIRRTSGFAKLAMRTIHLVHPRKKARFGGFKRKSRK